MFYSLIKSTFHVSKGLLCLYDEQNNTWLLVDMKFFFSCSTQNLTRSLRLLVRYRVKHAPMYYSLGNRLLYSVPEYQIRRLQEVMNASARLVYCAP